jgi:hypothetical protein
VSVLTSAAKSCVRLLIAASAASPRHAAHLSSQPAVAKMCAPNSCANWIAVTPMPLAPPWTSDVSPFASRPILKRLAQRCLRQGPGADRVVAYGPGQALWRWCSAILGISSTIGAHRRGRRWTMPSLDLLRRRLRRRLPGPGSDWHRAGARMIPWRCATPGRFTPAACTQIGPHLASTTGPGR